MKRIQLGAWSDFLNTAQETVDTATNIANQVANTQKQFAPTSSNTGSVALPVYSPTINPTIQKQPMSTDSSTKKIMLYGGLSILLGVAAFFGYKELKKRKAKKN